VESIPLELIRDDPHFQNLRLEPTAEELSGLAESMRIEGLKVPIEVIPSGEGYCVRCGFRRTRAARQLGWTTIPAIVLPADTPVVDEYWTNIIENSARSRLTSYEIAHAARTMREKFKVGPTEFSQRAGITERYVYKLLRCIDKLPPEIVEVWRDRAPIPIDLYDKWTNLHPEEAVKAMLQYCGRHPKVVGEWSPPPKLLQDRKTKLIKMASAAGLARMQRVRFAVEVARTLDERTRKLCVQLVDFCTGARDDVPGVFDNQTKVRAYKSRRREDLEKMETECPPSD
jgi:ParB/RepB/Spo0J family partition protein